MDLAALVEIRHDLHAHPQIRFEETYASELVQRELTRLDIAFRAGLGGGTGVLGYLPATTGESAPTIALRADMDALPILEETGLPYASQFPGRMHACGHDGHTTILLGVARELAAANHRPNDVLFVFQPAEEGGAGGKIMVDEGCLRGEVLGRKADMMFGLHGWTSVPVGRVESRIGPLMAATDEFIVEFHGQGGHAAIPQFAKDPIVAISAFVSAIQTMVSRNTDPFDQMVVTVGHLWGGTTNNVIPELASAHGTIRTMTDENRAMAKERLQEIAHGIASAYGLKACVQLNEGYPVVRNAPEAVERFVRIASQALGAEFVSDQADPCMGGEDFAYYGSECPSCFYFLGLLPEGQDSMPPVHTPRFDFNDDAIEVGVRVMTALALS